MTTTIDSEVESQLAWLQQEVAQLLLEHDRIKARTSWPQAAELVAVALFLYDRISLWNERHMEEETTEKEASSLFHRWHAAAKQIYSRARAAVPVDYPPTLLERFGDAIGYCPYVVINPEELRRAEREYDEGKWVSSEKVHDDIQRRLLEHRRRNTGAIGPGTHG